MDDTKYEIVSGKKIGYYDIKITKDINIRFFQMGQFDEVGQFSVRSYLFKGTGTNGGCFYEYVIENITDYKLNKKELRKFEKVLKNKKDSETYKIMYKYYPVYDLTFTPPPDGALLSQCNSELLN